MRLPGSHNTKGGEWTEVELIGQRQHDLHARGARGLAGDGGAAARAAPKRARSRNARGNPWSTLAAAQIVTPPIDVAERLAEMPTTGQARAQIHNTQLSVTAAMLQRGYPVDEVVARVMQATAIAAGREGASWDWRAEERAVRAMCRSGWRSIRDSSWRFDHGREIARGRHGGRLRGLPARPQVHLHSNRAFWNAEGVDACLPPSAGAAQRQASAHTERRKQGRAEDGAGDGMARPQAGRCIT